MNGTLEITILRCRLHVRLIYVITRRREHIVEILDVRESDRHPFNYAAYEERLRNSNEFTIAFFSDTHLGYAAYAHTNARGINLRELDGDRAMVEIAQAIVKDPTIHAVIHGGDFFHFSHPKARSIKNVQIVLNMFAKAGIMFFGQAGNHDVSDMRSDLTSVALLDDPSRKIFALWKPYQAYQIHDGIFLHAVSHHGLKDDEAPSITPVSDGLNIFSTHGAALDPKNATLMRCADSVREQIIPPEMVVDDNFIAKLLGHYHNRYAVGGGNFNTWYAGSTVRRGFSDDAGPRGWMKFTISPEGDVDVENKNISQRPQHDLDIIDASGMNAAEVQQLIEENIVSTGVDVTSNAFDELQAPIVRQQVVNAPRSLRAALNRKRISEMTRNMLHWDLKLASPEVTDIIRQKAEDGSLDDGHDHGNDHAEPTLSKGRGGGGGAVEFFDSWVENSGTLASIPEAKKEKVQKTARKHLENAESMRGK